MTKRQAAGARRSQRATPKIQRWMDLLVALLRRNYPVGFGDLAREVPAYADASRREEALERMFERDKDELRAFGIPIETRETEDGAGYVLRREGFYLPYLALVGRPARSVPPSGYRSLKTLAFEPDELALVADAAARAGALGDPALAAAAATAVRKLAFDLPLDVAASDAHLVGPRTRPDPAVLEALGAALFTRRRVTFDYRAMERDATERRTVEPWGLFFLHGHWYLAARDPQRGAGRDGLRNFRVSRVAGVAEQEDAAPVGIPADFVLGEHARSRQSWELGAGDAEPATVEFRAQSGATAPALRLGEPVPGAPLRRRFRVRRPDAFVRWVLSFAGDARPVEPASLVDEFRRVAARTRARYAGEPVVQGTATSAALERSGTRASRVHTRVGADAASDAASQLRRLLELVPRVADGRPRPIAELSRLAGTDDRTLLRDLRSLAERVDEPGGFVEGLEIYLTGTTAEVRTPHFLRPMRLTARELRALELGLAMLAGERPAEEHRAIDGARRRLRQALARAAGEADDDPTMLHAGAAPLDDAQRALLATLRKARLAHRRVRIAYRKAGETAGGERVVCPYALVAASGAWYLVAHCTVSDALRVFRLDRVAAAEPTAESFELPPDFRVDEVLREGRAFVTDAPPRALTVRYGPTVARWIAEREDRPLDADGGLTVEHPLADVDWAVRHVLQYGADAEVLAPADVRRAIAARLDTILAEVGA